MPIVHNNSPWLPWHLLYSEVSIVSRLRRSGLSAVMPKLPYGSRHQLFSVTWTSHLLCLQNEGYIDYIYNMSIFRCQLWCSWVPMKHNCIHYLCWSYIQRATAYEKKENPLLLNKFGFSKDGVLPPGHSSCCARVAQGFSCWWHRVSLITGISHHLNTISSRNILCQRSCSIVCKLNSTQVLRT